MLSYYRTLFDIRSDEDGLVGLSLMRDAEEILRTWVHQSFPDDKDILDDPRDARSGRMWEHDGALLRLSGSSMGEQGYFWLRWHVDDDGGNDYQRYLGFRLATEGDSVQADIEVRVGNRVTGHFDDAVRNVMDILLPRYRCAMLGSDLSQRADRLRLDQVEAFWERLSSPERCLPVVMVSEKRGGGMPVDSDILQHDLIGLADVVCCPDEVAWRLGWHSWRLLCYDGQVRVYAPGLGVDDDERRHRSWSFEEASDLEYDLFLQLLRDECAQRIHYPEGRDALRVFSRVRGRVRERIRADLGRENRLVYDEWSEEVSAKEDEIKRWREAYQRLQDDNDSLQEDLEQLRRAKRALEWRLQSGENRSAEGYGTPVVGGDEGPWSYVKTVADVIEVVKDWRYVRVFEQVAKDCTWMSRSDARGFYDVLESLNDCGEERAGILGSSEDDWMVGRGIRFTGRESQTTMNQYGEQRHFRDDNGVPMEMQPHIRIGKLRMHIHWSAEESRWLVGYFGRHLPIVSE